MTSIKGKLLNISMIFISVRHVVFWESVHVVRMRVYWHYFVSEMQPHLSGEQQEPFQTE